MTKHFILNKFTRLPGLLTLLINKFIFFKGINLHHFAAFLLKINSIKCYYKTPALLSKKHLHIILLIMKIKYKTQTYC